MKTKLIIVLFIYSILSSCGLGSNTKKSLQYGDDLNSTIESFEEERVKFSDDLEEVTKETSTALEDSESDIEEVAYNWEKKWEALTERLDGLEKEFTAVGRSSQEYFKNLDDNSAQIKDDKLRSVENTKNQLVKEQWTTVYQDASKSLKNVRGILEEGNDFYHVMLGVSLRKQVKSDIMELESISLKAVALLAELEAFSVEGKKLISQM